MESRPCPPPPANPCQQVCQPSPPLEPCRSKPIMRNLHWNQTKRLVIQGFIGSGVIGCCLWYFANKKKQRYAEFYANTDFDQWERDMAKKGLFQAVPKSD